MAQRPARVAALCALMMWACAAMASAQTTQSVTTPPMPGIVPPPGTPFGPQPPDTLPPMPPGAVTVADVPDDAGMALDVQWTASPSEAVNPTPVKGYRVLRSDSPNGPFAQVGGANKNSGKYRDESDVSEEDPAKIAKALSPAKQYYYQVATVGLNGKVSAPSPTFGPVHPEESWFNHAKAASLLFTVLIISLSVLPIYQARMGKHFYLRPIAGLQQLDEALGRAAEQGKPIVYTTGLGANDDPATLASIAILGRMAERCAEFQTRLIVPNFDIIVTAMCQETVREGYRNAGREDLFQPNDVFFASDSQFPYAAAVNGQIIREKAAAVFFMGSFKAESLLMAETGAMMGAIQIAGTNEITQLPFFVAACDYTLIGEELYAAGAYLSRAPMQIGTIKGQDYGKLLTFALLGVSIAMGLAFQATHSASLQNIINIFGSWLDAKGS